MHRSGRIALGGGVAVLALATVALAFPPPSIRVIRTVLEDDGDHDGYADTRETVQMRIEVRNLTGMDLTGLVALLSTDDPKVASITDNRIALGEVADGEIRLSDEAFTFVVGDVERASADESISVTFRVKTYSNRYMVLPDKGWFEHVPFEPPWNEITLDLDLDVSGGSGPTTYFEGFESGFGSFTTMHLDETLNPPPGNINNYALGVAAADGHRCQYSDPDWSGSASYNNSQGLVCYPSSDGVPDTYYFHIADERAFSGTQSLHYGVFLNPLALYSTPRAQLEAIRMTDPVNLGWANVCSQTRTAFCATTGDCPTGEACEPSSPRFTFRHQISMLDSRVPVGAPNVRQRSTERAIVGVQVASDDASPVGPWIRLEPFVNVYDTQANSNYFNCTFDPADDGNTEEDFFDPTDPERYLGPSSTCTPQYNFTFQGSTVGSDPTRVGKASDGPGLLGAKGPGTWVEPQYDLSRFRGRRLRLRFLKSGWKVANTPLWHPNIVNNSATNPDPRDDGWFIDDARVTDTLTTAAEMTADIKDNRGLPGAGDDGDDVVPDNCPTSFNPGQEDADLDGIGDDCDTCPFDFFDDRDGDGSCCPALADGSDDLDGDGLCGMADECPGVFEAGGSTYRLAVGGSSFAFPSDDSRLVTTSDAGLVSLAAAGGPVGVLDGDEIGPWVLTPDGSRVVYAAAGSLRSVSVEGGPPVELAEADVVAIALAQGPRVVYIDRASGVQVLFSVPLDGGTPLQLSVASHDLDEVLLTPDGSQAVYRLRHVFQGSKPYLYSVPVAGGPPVQLSTAEVWRFKLTADGLRVVYQGTSSKLYSVPVDGGSETLLATVVRSFTLTPDGTYAVYSRSSSGLYSVPVSGGAAIALHESYWGEVDAFVVTPDSAHVLYGLEADVNDVWELHAVPVTGGTSKRLAPGLSITDPAISPDERYWRRPTMAVTPNSTHAVFAAYDAAGVGLFSVAIEGGTPERLANAFPNPVLSISADGTSVAAIGQDGVQVVPIAGGQATTFSRPFSRWEQEGWIVSPAVFGPIAFSPDMGHIVFRVGAERIPMEGLFAAALGAEDGDGVPAACDCDDANALAWEIDQPEVNDGADNDCPGEPGHGLVDEIVGLAASDDVSFVFEPQPGATSYEVARAADASFGVDCSSTIVTEPSWEDPEMPPVGSTYFYLVRALTPYAGSWGHDSAGSERDPSCASTE